MNGLTNSLPGGDPAVEACLLAADAVAMPASSSSSMPGLCALSSPTLSLNSEDTSLVEPTADANAAASAVVDDGDSWRIELAARLERYRIRRKPRSPRYPSLLLPFDAAESWSRTAPVPGSGAAALAASPAGNEFVIQTNTTAAEVTQPEFGGPGEVSDATLEQGAELRRYPQQMPEQLGRVIAFPRSAAIPVFRPSGLADPVPDHAPRIVEAPEILPPPPALGGMLIEPAYRELPDTGADSPSGSASIARRVLAAVVDGTILSTAAIASAAIFLRLNPSLEFVLNSALKASPHQLRDAIPMLAGLGVVVLTLWAAYEFLFVVYTGSTPGLRATGLRLATFEGSKLNHRLRRWRVLASLLSALSVGLGYLWCLLDPDGLCWHDRITRTHVRYESQPTAPGK
jgi:uncharacterized RDD family membrane protein YckC